MGPDNDKTRAIKKFKKRKSRHYAGSIFLVLLIAVLMINEKKVAEIFNGMSALLANIVLFGFVGCVAIFYWVNWRCTFCNRYLGKNINPKFCPRCGEKLVEE